MEQNTETEGYGKFILLARKSWTAYVATIFVGLVSIAVNGLVLQFSFVLGIALTVIVVLATSYKLFEIHSYTLFYDDAGVWFYGGVLPWSKGSRGVKWRDLDEALYTPSLMSWLFSSYSVRIGHRYTKANEIFLSQMAHGNEAVMTINGLHREMVRSNQLS